MKTAVIIPALNEEKTIGKVVSDFRRQLPEAEVIVYDNNSTDRTAEKAVKAGARLRTEFRRGKGYVMKSALEGIDADVYVFVDGDDTYPAEAVKDLVKPVSEGEADMAVGSRMEAREDDSIKSLHVFGNRVIVGLINFCFGVRLADALSGYRVMNRNLAEHLNLISGGFEIETELTIRTLIDGFRIKEVPVKYRARPRGSESKLDSFSDGFVILWTIITLLRDHRPMLLFSIISIISVVLGVAMAAASTVYGAANPAAAAAGLLAALALIISGVQFMTIGLILHSIRSQNILLDQLIRRERK